MQPDSISDSVTYYLKKAREAYGPRGEAQLRNFLEQNAALFAGGSPDPSQRELLLEALTQAFFLNKEHARKKFGRKKEV